MDDAPQRRTNAVAGIATVALLTVLLIASVLVSRWPGAKVGLDEGLRLVESAEAEQRLAGLVKLMGDLRAAPAFARLLDDPDARVRLMAAFMLASVAGFDTSSRAAGETDADLIKRMKVWWKHTGRTMHEDE